MKARNVYCINETTTGNNKASIVGVFSRICQLAPTAQGRVTLGLCYYAPCYKLSSAICCGFVIQRTGFWLTLLGVRLVLRVLCMRLSVDV